VSFEAEEGTFLTLLGPSGCGKTTTLRSVAGLETPDAGTIRVADRVLFSSDRRVNVSANTRGLGMVFQSYAIWPHMTVFQNVAFPLTIVRGKRRLSRPAIRKKVEEVLGIMQLSGLEDRSATRLSGGQQQRLALARALVTEPPLLLLDEPLSNLDASLREELRFELKRLQRTLGITTLYVTHDQSEALAMSNYLAVMNQGLIEQIGKPREVYDTPATSFVASFIGTSNFIEGTVLEKSGDAYTVQTEFGVLKAVSPAELAKGLRVTVAVRPEHIQLKSDDGDAASPGAWRGVVRERAFLGDSHDYVIGIGDLTIRVRSDASQNFPANTPVRLELPEGGCSLLPT
jgi:iron(III) transport system ATP-binding protein